MKRPLLCFLLISIVTALFLFSACNSSRSGSEDFDVLILNGLIYDGSGNEVIHISKVYSDPLVFSLLP